MSRTPKTPRNGILLAPLQADPPAKYLRLVRLVTKVPGGLASHRQRDKAVQLLALGLFEVLIKFDGIVAIVLRERTGGEVAGDDAEEFRREVEEGAYFGLGTGGYGVR